MIKHVQNERGLTLIEIVASLVILSFALLMMSNFLIRSFEQSSNQDSRMVAMNLARQIAEQWRSGNGSIETLGTNPPTLPESLPRANLSYDNLEQLQDTLNTSELVLAPITVNERTYTPSVLLSRYPDSSAVRDTINPSSFKEDPLIIISITIRGADNTTLALLQTAVSNPQKGDPTDAP